jgi:Cu2+-exporting ATPase
LFRLHDAAHDKKAKPAQMPQQEQARENTENAENPDSSASDGQSENKQDKENTTMTKTMKIEGMMCEHCEARVKKTLEKFAEVDQAVVSHTAGTAVLTLNAEVDNEALKQAVEAQDYTVTEIL